MTIFGLLITDISRLNYDRIPAVLFRSLDDRNEFIRYYAPMSWREFQYEIEEEYGELDLIEGAPLIYPNL